MAAASSALTALGFDLARYISFVDEAGHSEDPHRKYFCLAGLLASETSWKALDDEWRIICAREGLRRPFHMKDLSCFKGDFAGWTEEQRRRLLGGLVQAIQHARAIPVGSVVSLEGFRALDGSRKQAQRDPYFIAFQHLTFHLAVASAMRLPPGTVSMVYAHHPEYSEGLGNSGELWEAVRKCNPMIAGFMARYMTGTPTEHVALQAADLWAYELAHHFEIIRPRRMSARWPFQRFVEMGLNYEFTHDFVTYDDGVQTSGLGRWSLAQ